MSVLVIDNFDSFVYNLARYINCHGYQTTVTRNNSIRLSDITPTRYTHIILSPGPGTPNQAGYCIDIIQQFSGYIPILGICLGHQSIAQAWGGHITRAQEPMHGMASTIQTIKHPIFDGLSNRITVGRYHSLVVERETLPHDLAITALSNNGEIMAISHKKHDTVGLQFHPESILTDDGYTILGNFLHYTTLA